MGSDEIASYYVLVWGTVVFVNACWQLYQVFLYCRDTGCPDEEDDDGDDDPDDGEPVPVNDEDIFIGVKAA